MVPSGFTTSLAGGRTCLMSSETGEAPDSEALALAKGASGLADTAASGSVGGGSRLGAPRVFAAELELIGSAGSEGSGSLSASTSSSP